MSSFSFFLIFNSYSQIIILNEKAYKYPKVIKDCSYYYNETFLEKKDTLVEYSFYVKEEDLHTFPQKKVGQMIEYFENGSIKNIGFWNDKNDTFSIDSNKIIVFVNPCVEIRLKQSYCEIDIDYQYQSSNQKTYKVSEISNWSFCFNNKGILVTEVLNNTKISYFEKHIVFEVFKNNTIVDSWIIFK